MGKFIDLTGQKFGRLTAKSKLPLEDGQKLFIGYVIAIVEPRMLK